MQSLLILAATIPIALCQSAHFTMDEYWEMCSPVFGDAIGTAYIQVDVDIQSANAAPFGIVAYSYFLEPDQRIGYLTPKSAVIVDGEKCKMEDVGKVIVADGIDTTLFKSVWVSDKKTATLKMPIINTNYYCVRLVNPNMMDIKVTTAFENTFGKLPAEFYYTMKTTVWLMITYGLIAGVWIYLCHKHAEELLTLQKYIGGLLDILFVEMAVMTVFYHNYNKTGSPSLFWMTAVSLVSSLRASASLFLTLIVSMGYGTVRADLKGRERAVYSLTIAHAVLSVVNILCTIASSDRSLFYILLLACPLALLNVIFFLWSMNEIKETKGELEAKKQPAKLAMYNRLTRAMDAIVTIAAMLLIISMGMIVSGAGSRHWMAKHWRSFWFFADGWSTMIVFGGSVTVAWLWRPRQHNRTFGMEQVAGDEEDPTDAVVTLEPVLRRGTELKDIVGDGK